MSLGLCGICAHPKHEGKCEETLMHDVGTLCPCVIGISVMIPLSRYNEFIEFESGRSVKSLALFAADIEDTLHAIANIVGIENRLDPAIIEAVRKLVIPQPVARQGLEREKSHEHPSSV
jgi:hypothetical protein